MTRAASFLAALKKIPAGQEDELIKAFNNAHNQMSNLKTDLGPFAISREERMKRLAGRWNVEFLYWGQGGEQIVRKQTVRIDEDGTVYCEKDDLPQAEKNNAQGKTALKAVEWLIGPVFLYYSQDFVTVSPSYDRFEGIHAGHFAGSRMFASRVQSE